MVIPHVFREDSGWAMRHQIPLYNTTLYPYFYSNRIQGEGGMYNITGGRIGSVNVLSMSERDDTMQQAVIEGANISFEMCTTEYNYFNSGELNIAAGDKYARRAVKKINFIGLKIISILGEANDNVVVRSYVVRLFDAKFTQGLNIIHDFIPVLDASGTPCMYDKISKQCFYNAGSGTFGYRIKITGAESAPFSLRDPYYTAPSGVYARPSGDNQLEILADTEEPAGDGWEWFANTGDAYEHFGIKQEELLTNETTND